MRTRYFRRIRKMLGVPRDYTRLLLALAIHNRPRARPRFLIRRIPATHLLPDGRIMWEKRVTKNPE